MSLFSGTWDTEWEETSVDGKTRSRLMAAISDQDPGLERAHMLLSMLKFDRECERLLEPLRERMEVYMCRSRDMEWQRQRLHKSLRSQVIVTKGHEEWFRRHVDEAVDRLWEVNERFKTGYWW